MSMRIAMLSWESLHSIPVGGLAAHVSELSQALHQRGHDVHVLTRMGPNQSRYDCIDGVHYHRCPFEPHPDFVTYIEQMCDAFMSRLKDAESFYDSPFDVIHGHDWLSAKALVRTKNELNRRTVLTVHSTEFGRCGNELRSGMSCRIRAVEREGAYVADRVICVSRALRDEVARLYEVPNDKMTVVYNGVDVGRFDVDVDVSSVRDRYAVGADDPFVLFAGRLAWQKGPDLLVDAMPAVLDRCPRAKLVLAGDGDMRESLEESVSAKRLSHAARFAGYRNGPELVSLFKAADAVCVPSRNEPFGIVILEAWSATKPVVATLNGGPAEFVRNNETGLIVSADEGSIGGAIEIALTDPEDSKRMGRNGRHDAESRFSWDVIAHETEQLYQSL